MSEFHDTPDARQRAEAFFQKGHDSALKGQHDYAIQMFRDACKLVPDNLHYRQALRAITRKKFLNDPHKVGMLAGARLQPARLRARGEKGKGHWGRALDACEDAFQIHPWDLDTSVLAAESALGLGAATMAVWLIESVFAQGQKDADYLRGAASVLEQAGQFEKARVCWELVRKLNPHDEQAKRQINALSASATIVRSGLVEAVQRVDVIAPASPSSSAVVALDALKKRQPESPEQRLRREIVEEPARVGPYLELADLLRQKNRLDDAEKVLAAARKAAPEDEVVRSAYGDVQMARLLRAVEHYQKKVDLEPDDVEASERLRMLREKADAYELTERRHRVKAEPTAEARLDLGACLARQGRHDEAIAEFQQARGMGTPAQKLEALRQSGLCFEAKGLPKLAERSYQDALKLADGDDQAMINALHYRLGRVAELLGDLAAAEEHYNEVAANDFAFEDVAERLRALVQRR